LLHCARQDFSLGKRSDVEQVSAGIVFRRGLKDAEAVFELGNPAFERGVVLAEVLVMGSVLTKCPTEEIEDVCRPFFVLR